MYICIYILHMYRCTHVKMLLPLHACFDLKNVLTLHNRRQLTECLLLCCALVW